MIIQEESKVEFRKNDLSLFKPNLSDSIVTFFVLYLYFAIMFHTLPNWSSILCGWTGIASYEFNELQWVLCVAVPASLSLNIIKSLGVAKLIYFKISYVLMFVCIVFLYRINTNSCSDFFIIRSMLLTIWIEIAISAVVFELQAIKNKALNMLKRLR